MRTIPTTKANPEHQPAPNPLQGDFAADRPNAKRCADITYIPTQEGWLYLAVILDLFSRRIVGWAMPARMTKELVCDALRMALRQRQPALGHLSPAAFEAQYESATVLEVSDFVSVSSG